MATPVYLVDQQGEVLEFADPQEAQFALAGGLSPASEQQVAEFQRIDQRKKEFGTAGQQAIAGVEGALRGATFGLSDVALTGLGIADAKRMAARREENPTAALTGEIGGAIAPIIASGGTGAFGQAARLAPTAALSRGAAALGERAGVGLLGTPVVGEGLATALGRAAVTAGTAEAVEGAVYGAGTLVTEAALGDSELTAEQLLSTVGLDALLSGGAGVLIGSGGVAIPRAVRRLRDAVDRGEKVVVDTAERVLPEAAATLGGADVATAREVITGRKDIITDPAENERIRRNLAESLQDQLDAFYSADRLVATRLKPAEVDRLLESVPVQQGEAAIQEAQSRLRLAAENARKNALVGDSVASRLDQLADSVEESYRANIPATPAAVGPQRQLKSADAYWAIDNLKRDLDELANFDRAKTNEANRALFSARGQIKDLLEDANYWGEQARRQALLNESWNEGIIAANQILDQFGKTVRAEKFGKERVIDPVKINTYLNATADDRRRLRDEFIDRFTSAMKAFADQMEQSAANAPTEQFSRRLLDELAKKSDDAIAEAQYKGRLRHLVSMMSNESITSSGPTMVNAARSVTGALAGPVLGGAVAGPLGVAAGLGHAAYQIATDVPLGAVALLRFERIAQQTSKALDASANALARGIKIAEPKARSAATAALSIALGEDDDDYRRLAADPERLAAKVSEATRELDNVAPVTANAVRVAIGRQIANIGSVVPPEQQSAPLAYEQKPSPMEQQTLRYALEAVNGGPDVLLRLASKNALTQTHVDTFRMVYPKLFEDLQQRVLMALSSALAEGKRPPYAARQQMSLILGTDLDGSLSQTAALQGAYATMQQTTPSAPPSKAQRPTRADMAMTDLQRSAAEG